MLRQFPFHIPGFHSDDGSEFLNRAVARLLDKLRIEQTRSRPRQSGDNGLVETKNGWVVRKHIGYGSIDQAHAERIHGFYRDHLHPYLNYHRPCAQPEIEIDPKGRKRIRYRRYRTPLETLLARQDPNQFPRRGLGANAPTRIAAAHRDTEAAQRMQQAKARLFDQLRSTARSASAQKQAQEIWKSKLPIPTFPPPRRLLHSHKIQNKRSLPKHDYSPPFRPILRLEKTVGMFCDDDLKAWCKLFAGLAQPCKGTTDCSQI